MFKCSECGAEFEIKPDFCDCGNDIFEEINIIEEQEKNIKKVDVAKENSIQKIEKKEKEKEKSDTTSYYSYDYWDKIKRFFDPLSTIIFLICTLLSFYIIFYAWNPVEKEYNAQQLKPIGTINTKIPSIEKIWNDTPPAQQIKEDSPIVEEVKKFVEPIKKVEQKIVQPKQKKQEVKQSEKIKTTTKSTTTTVKTTPATKVSTNVTSTSATPVQKPIQPVINKQELNNYKIALRNRIALKIDFANVIGDGSCVVSFNLTNSGQLTNKKFVKQSDNFSLNDVVYNALIKINSFNPPPTSYNGETLKLTVKMNDGNFEVTLY